MFMSGIIGRLMREFAFTVSVAVALSVFLSLTFTPMMCGKFLQASGAFPQSVHGRSGGGIPEDRSPAMPAPWTW